MSGISGGWLGGQNDLSPTEDAFYQRQIDRIRKREQLPEPPKSIRRRRPRTQLTPKPDRSDDDDA